MGHKLLRALGLHVLFVSYIRLTAVGGDLALYVTANLFLGSMREDSRFFGFLCFVELLIFYLLEANPPDGAKVGSIIL